MTLDAGDRDELGLPLRPTPVAVPVGAPVEVGLRLVEVDAAGASAAVADRCYLLTCGAGTSTLVPVATLAGGLLVLEVRARRADLVRWVHDDVLLGHLITAGTASVDGDLMALALVDGWAWYRRRADGREAPLPACSRPVGAGHPGRSGGTGFVEGGVRP